MDVEANIGIAAARTDAMIAGSVAVAGIFALCNELHASGALEETQINKVREFMLVISNRSFASTKLQNHLINTIESHFADMQVRFDKESEG